MECRTKPIYTSEFNKLDKIRQGEAYQASHRTICQFSFVISPIKVTILPTHRDRQSQLSHASILVMSYICLMTPHRSNSVKSPYQFDLSNWKKWR